MLTCIVLPATCIVLPATSKSTRKLSLPWRLISSGRFLTHVRSIDIVFSWVMGEAVENYNEEVRQNREMLRNIGVAVLYLAKQELARRGHDKCITSLNKSGNYRKLLVP